MDEERALYAAYTQAAAQVGRGGSWRCHEGGWAPGGRSRPLRQQLSTPTALRKPVPLVSVPLAHWSPVFSLPSHLPCPQVTPAMSVPAFLAAAEGLITPLDAYFEKVFVMCDNEVS